MLCSGRKVRDGEKPSPAPGTDALPGFLSSVVVKSNFHIERWTLDVGRWTFSAK